MVTLTIPGLPRGKDRPRFDPRTKRTYTPRRTVVAERAIQDAWVQAGRPRFPDVALRMTVTTRVQRPRAHLRADGERLSAAGLRHPVPTGRPDLDNVLKLVADGLNGLAYRDDALIAEAVVRREWADWPETVVTIEVVDALAEDVEPVDLGRAA